MNKTNNIVLSDKEIKIVMNCLLEYYEIYEDQKLWKSEIKIVKQLIKKIGSKIKL